MAVKTLKLDLPEEIFDVTTNVPLIHQVVVAQQAAARQGTASTKTRGEVRGGGRKPYKQKGTGRARQGSIRAPQFAGGGTVHGPQPRSYEQRTPKKMKAAALRGALSDRARHGRIHVVESLVTGTEPSTKAAKNLLSGLSERKNILVVLERSDLVSLMSVRNLPNVHVLAADQLNTYDVLCSDDIVFTKAGYDAFVTQASASLGKRGSAVAIAAMASGDVAAAVADAPKNKAKKEAAPAKEAKADEAGKAAKADKAPAKAAEPKAAETKAAEPKAEKAAAKADKPAAKAADAKAEKPAEAAPSGDVPKGAVVALADGAAPSADYTVKGNADSGLYHAPGGRWYDATVAEFWFKNEKDAEAAGFRKAGSRAKKTEDTK